MRQSRPRRISAVLAAAILAASVGAPSGPAHAVTPQEILPDKALEARAREISAGLRCLVCQNQSIDDSDAPLAHDLRILVRERLTAGDSDVQVRDFVVARYGEFVLLKPPFSVQTALLWLMPLFVLVGAVLILWSSFRPTREVPVPAGRGEAGSGSPALSPDEQAALEALLGSEDKSRS